MNGAWAAGRAWALSGLMAMAGQAQGMNCQIVSSPQFTFGHYDPLSPMALDVQASFLVQCTPAFPGEVLNLQVRLAGTPQPLQMQNLQTGEWLKFSIYADPARTRLIDNQQTLVLRFPLVTSTLLSLPVYGRVPARQPVSVGSYQMNISVILTY